MARDWESVFGSWGDAPSATQQEKAANAERVIRDAVQAHSEMEAYNISVFTQGSYRNRTNVREDSDVDVCVLCHDAIFTSYGLAPGCDDDKAGLGPSQLSYAAFRLAVGNALTAYLGAGSVARGNKAYDVHANTYRLDADVVACFEYRQYQTNADGSVTYSEGTAFLPDSGGRIHNWPQQNYDNGVSKNDSAGMYFKPAVRIFKRLRNEMASDGVTSALQAPSFKIESLIYNLPSMTFKEPRWIGVFQKAVRELQVMLSSEEGANELVEVNELKYLFRGSDGWNRSDALAFINDAWNHYLSLAKA